MKLVDQIKDTLSFKEVVDYYNENYTETIKYLRTNCPKHHKFDLLHYFDSKKTWCYGCSWTGDIFNYIMEKEHSDFPTTVHKACEIAGIEYKPDNLTPDQIAQWKKEKEERESAYALFKNKIEDYHKNLFNFPDIVDYCKSRGLTEETIRKLKIGFITDETQEDLLDIGLVGKSKEGDIFCPYKKRLVLPYFNLNQEPIYAIFRETKYTYKPTENQKDNRFKKLYSSSQIKHTLFYYAQPETTKDTIIITEGIFDAYSVVQAGYDTASFITVQPKESDLPELFPIVKGYKKIVVVFDNEKSESGQRGTQKLVEHLFKEGYTNTFVYTIPRPEGIDKIDLNDLLKELSVEEQKEKVKQIVSETTEAIKYLTEGLPFKTATTRTNSYNYLTEVLKPLFEKDELFFWEVIKDIAEFTKQKHSELKTVIKQKLKLEKKKDITESSGFKIKEALGSFSDYLQMADKFIETQPLFYTPQKIWWMWDFEIKAWVMVDEIDLLNQVDKCTDGMRVFEAKTKTEVINALKMRGRLNTPKEAKKTWIQFKDVIHDIETGDEFEATPEYFITNPIPWELGQKEDTPEMDKMFAEWVSKDDVQALYEIIAYSMLPDYPLHRVFCLNGEGRNGKGSFLKILTEFVSKRNRCSTDLDTLLSRPFESAKLYKKLICIMGEINSSIFKKTSLFKKLTGDDTIGFEFKGKDGFDDYNYAKMIIATNKLPETTDKTTGFYSRWRIIDFNNRFEEYTKLLTRIPEQEYKNLAKKSIHNLKQVLDSGQFTGDGKIEERMRRYEERASPIRDFLKKDCVIDERYQIAFWKVYEEYVSFLDMRGFRKASKRELSNLLKTKGFETKRVHFEKKDGTRGTMIVVLGLGLENELEECEAEAIAREEMGALHT